MELDIPSITGIVTAVGVIVGVLYYIFDIRHQTKIRETDLEIRMNPVFNLTALELQRAMAKVLALEYKDYGDFVMKYGSMISEAPSDTMMAILTVGNFSEAIGYLLKRNLVGMDYVWDCYADSAISLWEKVRPVVEGARKQYNMPRLWEPFEYLYNEVKKKERQLASRPA